MFNSNNSEAFRLGFLRLGMIGIALLMTLLSLGYLLLKTYMVEFPDDSLWIPVLNIVTPVLSLLFSIVILFDYVMSRVRAADTEDSDHIRFKRISRLELRILGLLLLYWVPYFYTLIR